MILNKIICYIKGHKRDYVAYCEECKKVHKFDSWCNCCKRDIKRRTLEHDNLIIIQHRLKIFAWFSVIFFALIITKGFHLW